MFLYCSVIIIKTANELDLDILMKTFYSKHNPNLVLLEIHLQNHYPDKTQVPAKLTNTP
jgi:hypothetical protein